MTQTEERNYLKHILNIDKSLQNIAAYLKTISENTKQPFNVAVTVTHDWEPIASRTEEEIKQLEEQEKLNEALATAILFGDGSRKNS